MNIDRINQIADGALLVGQGGPNGNNWPYWVKMITSHLIATVIGGVVGGII
jgi:hypothetical protein